MQSGWRSARAVDSERAPKGGGKGGGNRYMLDETPVRIHLSNPEEMYDHPSGAKVPFYTGERYYVPNVGKNGRYFYTDGKTIIDAWRNPEKFELDLKPLAKFQDVKDPQIFYAISGWVEEWFHVVEERNQRTGSKYHVRELCTGPGCKYCKANEEKVFGKKVFLVFSQSQWDGAMWTANEKAHSRCKCGGIVFTSYYVCEECKEALYDFASCCYSCNSDELTIDEENEEFVCDKCGVSWSIFPFNNAELYKEVSAKTKCKCGHEAVPEPVQFCSSCESPDSHDLMDYQMKMSAVEKGRAKVVHITDMVIKKPDPRLFEAKMQAKDPELGEKLAEANKAPIDLRKSCSVTSNDTMAEILKVANPFSMSSGDDDYKNYSRNQSDNGGGEDEPDNEDKTAKRSAGRPKVGKPKGKPSFARPNK